MALVHDAIYHSDTQARLDLPSYLHQVIDGVSQSATVPVDVERELPENYEVELSFAILFGLVVNELVSHALRIGQRAELGERKSVLVRLTVEEEIVLQVSDTEEATTPDTSAGVLIVEALAGQLEGEITYKPEGITEFRLPRS
jgi:two-component sensor histidine kinase